jgi:threonine dehydrogenase-like Zn-dependent dehydrogenase
MRVITASNYGGPEVLRVEERPAPQPQADDVLVEVKAAGVNLMDIYARELTEEEKRGAAGRDSFENCSTSVSLSSGPTSRRWTRTGSSSG